MENTIEISKNLPERKFRAGAISATVWKNVGISKDGTPSEYRTVSLQRAYKDKGDNWKSTNSLRVGDLPKATLVLTKAYEYLVLKDLEVTEQDSREANQLEEDIVM